MYPRSVPKANLKKYNKIADPAKKYLTHVWVSNMHWWKHLKEKQESIMHVWG